MYCLLMGILPPLVFPAVASCFSSLPGGFFLSGVLGVTTIFFLGDPPSSISDSSHDCIS